MSPLVFVFPLLVSHCAFSVGLRAPAVCPHVHAVHYLLCCHCLHHQHLPMQTTLTVVICSHLLNCYVCSAAAECSRVQLNFKEHL